MKRAPLIIAIAFTAIMIIIGYLAASSSSYVDVSELSRYTKPETVIVKGKVVNTIIDSSTDTLIFVLQGKDGSLLEAYYSLSKFQSLYGGLPSHQTVAEEIIMKGIFHPKNQGKLLGYMDILEILQGCHKAYEAPPVSD